MSCQGLQPVVKVCILLVFQAKNIQIDVGSSGWGGTYLGQPMNPAVFVWVAEVEFLDGEVVFLKGEISLVR